MIYSPDDLCTNTTLICRARLLLDRALGSFLGLAIGDALGATVEFMTAREIAAQYKVHQEIIGGGWLHLKPGRVTDDTEMALALGSAVIASGGWNLRAIADAFVAWMRRGPVDIGNTCRRGISQLYFHRKLMRAVRPKKIAATARPCAICPRCSPRWQAKNCSSSAASSRRTSPTTIRNSDAATAALARMTRRLLLEGAQARLQSNRRRTDRAGIPKFNFKPWPGNTSGYIVDTVQTVFDGFFSTGSFEDCLVRVVNRGGDADTTGALAGQLAGALYGVQGIPARWLNKLDPGRHRRHP